MTGFWWFSGHLGWGIFALTVFTGIWWLLSDLCWRLLIIRVGWLVTVMGIGWLVGFVFILLEYHFGSL